MKKSFVLLSMLGLVAAFLLFSAADPAQASDKTIRRNPEPDGLRKTAGVPVSTLININNIASWIGNNGKSALSPITGQEGTWFPRGTAGVIFQDGIVWGGNVNDGGSQLLRVGGQTYSIGTQGGRIISAGVAEPFDAPDVRIYRIRRDYKIADLRQDAAETLVKAATSVTDGEIAAIRNQYALDWQQWPADQGAPFYDKNGDGRYDPAVDEPGVADADQVIWFVCNDLNPGLTNGLYGSNPIGMELQVTLWGYNRTDPLANVFFKKFTFIYKGTATTPPGSTITDMYACQWSDPDLGDSGDDFAGCDTTLSMAYVYNGGPTDNKFAGYGLKPPAVGYDFLQGPLVQGAPSDSGVFGLKRVYGKKNLPMSAAFYFAAGGTYSDPLFNREGTIRWYNLLRGLTPITGTPFVHPDFPGQPTRFWLDGDPTTNPPTGRVDGKIDSPGDRRIGACTGPFTMALGDTQEIVVGVVAGIGSNYLQSVTIMKNNDIAVQNAYNDLFNLPKAPPAPNLNAIALDREVVLDWGSDVAAVRATEDFNRKGYTFQGYNVYQLPSTTASFSQAIKVATYDVVDGVRTIYDDVFDVGLGIVVRQVRQEGTDNGVKRFLDLTLDRVRSQPFVNGQRFFFAVTAYGYNPDPTALTAALESSLQIVTVVPQVPNPGVRLSAPYGDTLTVVNTNPGKKSDGAVQSIVVDPNKMTGKNYKVSFKTIQTTFSYPSGDVEAPVVNWYLVRDGRDTVARGVNQGPTVTIDPGDGDVIAPKNGNLFDYPTVDGMFVTVSGPPPLINRTRTEWTGTEWWTDASGVGGRFTLGGPGARKLRSQASTGFDMTNYLGAVGSTLDPSQYVDIEFRFGDGGSLKQKAYRYNRGASPIETGSQYKFQDYSDVPFQVFDISNPASPRQLNVGYRDNDLSGGWEPSGGVEVIFVTKTTYDGATPTSYGTTVGSSARNIQKQDVMFVAEWISDNLAVSDIKASTIHISPNYVNGPDDVFSFNATAPPAYDQANAKADVSRINVFPNPYYGFNRAETTRFNRFVTFNHLPPKAEVRIFNLAGVLVRSIAKDDPTQYLNWDLNNQNNLPVASGLYIVYINMPDLGATKTLKLIVVQEQQYLDYY